MKSYNLYYGSQAFPKNATVTLMVDYKYWCFGLGIAHHRNYYVMAKETVIECLCFKFRFFSFDADKEI